MAKPPRRPGNSSRQDAKLFETLLVCLVVVATSALVLRVVENQQAFLDFYFLPIAWASWRLGRRRGVATAIASALIVLGAAFMNDELFTRPGSEAWVRWADLGLWAGFLFLAANTIAWLAERDLAHIENVRAIYSGVLEIMAKFIDSMDRSTDNHSRRVAQLAIGTGRHMGLSGDSLETLRVAAYLHDIGKVEVSGELLQKAAALTAEERIEMERHVDYGTDMLKRLGGLLENVVPLVMYHHERWDGRGYKGLAGDEIPLGARIITVCDTYDAIVADRPYRRGRSHGDAIEILRAGTGTQFDPSVIAAFLAANGEAISSDPGEGRESEAA